MGAGGRSLRPILMDPYPSDFWARPEAHLCAVAGIAPGIRRSEVGGDRRSGADQGSPCSRSGRGSSVRMRSLAADLFGAAAAVALSRS